jgi:hypothetical protein
MDWAIKQGRYASAVSCAGCSSFLHLTIRGAKKSEKNLPAKAVVKPFFS